MKRSNDSGDELEALWRRVIQGTASSQEKVKLAGELGRSGDSVHRARLLSLTDDDDSETRQYALQALVLDLKQKDEVVKDVCWRLLKEDPDEYVRSMAATCVGSCYWASYDSKAFSSLLEIIKCPQESDFVKGSIYRALLEVAGRPPSEWPGHLPSGALAPRKLFEEADIDWEKVARLEDEVRAKSAVARKK